MNKKEAKISLQRIHGITRWLFWSLFSLCCFALVAFSVWSELDEPGFFTNGGGSGHYWMLACVVVGLVGLITFGVALLNLSNAITAQAYVEATWNDDTGTYKKEDTEEEASGQRKDSKPKKKPKEKGSWTDEFHGTSICLNEECRKMHGWYNVWAGEQHFSEKNPICNRCGIGRLFYAGVRARLYGQQWIDFKLSHIRDEELRKALPAWILAKEVGVPNPVKKEEDQ